MNKLFERNPIREFPNGNIGRAYPFHISLEGIETKVLCRDDGDYDVFVKIICICALRKNCILLVYAVVSNHAHATVLALSQGDADAYANEIKRMYAMYFSRKYSDLSVMRGVDAKSIYIHSDYYLRNAIAYDIRNAVDNGAKQIADYNWTSFSAYFRDHSSIMGRKAASLSKRERRRIMHTDDIITDESWLLDENDMIIPHSICNYKYVEGAFNNDSAYFMKMIGVVDKAEMTQSLIIAPRVKVTDGELLKYAEEVSERFFKTKIHNLSIDKKTRIITYVFHTRKTDLSQLSRIFELNREYLSRLLG